MGEKILRRQYTKKFLIALLIGTFVLGGLIVGLVLLNIQLVNANWEDRTIKIYGLLRFFVIISIFIDACLIFQWIIFLFFRTD
ncbi:MAG: hypothetical protein ACTSRE_12475 [Promethearchaeota archaeon]